MDWQQLIVGILSSGILLILKSWLGIKADDAQREKLKWALEQGVAAAAVRFAPGQGGEKKELAIRTAESLAPKAMKELDPEQKRVMVDATYARMKASLPASTVFVHHGDALAHQTESVMRPTPMPPYRGPKT